MFCFKPKSSTHPRITVGRPPRRMSCGDPHCPAVPQSRKWKRLRNKKLERATGLQHDASGKITVDDETPLGEEEQISFERCILDELALAAGLPDTSIHPVSKGSCTSQATFTNFSITSKSNQAGSCDNDRFLEEAMMLTGGQQDRLNCAEEDGCSQNREARKLWIHRRLIAENAHLRHVVAEQSQQLLTKSSQIQDQSRLINNCLKRQVEGRGQFSHDIPLPVSTVDPNLTSVGELALRSMCHGGLFACEGHFHSHLWQQHSQCSYMLNVQALRVEQIHNTSLFEEYCFRKQRIKHLNRQYGVTVSPLQPEVPQYLRNLFHWIELDPLVNEQLLFHGTSLQNVQEIIVGGFDERLARHGCNLYGDGIYFAEDSCKSCQYCGVAGWRCIIVSRVALGDPYLAPQPLQALRRPPKRRDGGFYDSVVANSGTPIGPLRVQNHREFVIFDRTQALPELAIYFHV